MKLPDGWPEAKLPRGWEEPKFDRRLIEAAQNPIYRQTALGFEDRLRKRLERTDVGAVITLPYVMCPDLRRISCKLARYYGLRPLKNSTTTFATKNWTAPVYKLKDIPLKKGALEPAVPDPLKNKEIRIDGTGDNTKGKSAMVVDTSEKSKGKAPMIYGTSEKSKGKAPKIDGTSEESEGKAPIVDITSEKLEGKAQVTASKGNMPDSPGIVKTTSTAQEVPGASGFVKIGDSVKLDLGVNRTETTSQEEEVSDVPELVGIGGSLKLGLSLNQTQTQSPEETDETSKNEENLMNRKRDRDRRWENEEDMVLYLRTNRWFQLEAICALYRHDRMIREQTTTIRLAESNYQKITLLVEFLTNGNGHGPRVRTLNELEEIYPGSTALCSWLVVTYANQLYSIYCNKSDLYFC